MADLFEIWNVIENTPPRLRDEKLDRLCGNDETLKNDVLNLIEVASDVEMSPDAYSVSFSSFVESSFDPKTLLGKDVGNYTLMNYITSGGMGHIFYAERLDGLLVNQKAVVKVVKPHLINVYDYDLIDREANIMAQLKHKYITRVFDAGVIDYNNLKLPFYVMDYVDYGNITDGLLNSLIFSNIKNTIQAVLKVCDALHFAHSSYSYIHADIKPSNILMDKQGDPLLCDFGIAQRAKKKVDEKNYEYAEVFSCDYSSPELKNNEPLTFGSDVYSIALVLYELLTRLKPPFDVRKNLPSDNISFSPDEKKYKRWIKELDSILLKATEPNKEKRYKTMAEFSHDLSVFLELGYVKSHNNNYFYRIYKHLFLKPVHAALATAGAVSCITFSVISYTSSGYIQQQHNNNTFLTQIANNYAHYVQNEQFDALTNLKSIIDNTEADKALVYQHAMAIANAAMQKGDPLSVAAAISLYKKAISVAKNKYLPLVSALYAKALSFNDRVEQAQAAAQPFMLELEKNGFVTVEHALGYLALFDTDVKYISEVYGDDDKALSTLKQIEKLYWQDLALDQQGLLKYYQAREYFYYYDGSNISPGDGVSEDDHNRYLTAVLTDAQSSIEQAIHHIPDSVSGNELLIKSINLKSRVLYELGDYNEALDAAKQTIDMASELPGNDNELVMESWRNQYVVNRLLDLPLATQSIKAATDYYGWRKFDGWMLNSYLLGVSYLYQGDIASAEREVHKAITYFENYNKSADRYGFVGLDSIRVLLINYLEFTGFDRTNPLLKPVADTLLSTLLKTNEDYNDMVEPYELQLVKLYYDFANYNDDKVLASIAEVLALRKGQQGFVADDNARVMLDIALIERQINAQSELGIELAKKAEALFVWRDLEKTHSPDKMNIYLQLANIYFEHGKHEQYTNAMREAEMVYNSHYEALKDSFYAPLFAPKSQISLVN